MEVTDGSRGTLIDQKYYEGYCIDLIKHIADDLGFKYTYELVSGPQGSYDPKTKSWSGLIRHLLDHVRHFVFLKNSIYINKNLN